MEIASESIIDDASLVILVASWLSEETSGMLCEATETGAAYGFIDIYRSVAKGR